ncbi:MAG: peptidoglycan-binding protein [Patescibacteria group bacterium]
MKKANLLLISAVLALNPLLAFAQTDATLIIKQLQEQIKILQAQVEELKTQITQIKTELNLTRSLSRGLSGDDVKELQTFLKQKYPEFYTAPVTGYFGPLTEAAVRRLQEREGIEALGIVGPKTTSKINELITQGAGQSGVVPPGLLTAPGIQAPGIEAPTVQTTVPAPAVTAPATSVTTPTVGGSTVVPVASVQQTTTTSTTTSSATTSTTTSSSSSSSGTSVPSTPLNFSVTGGVATLSMSWSAPDNTIVASYRIDVTNTNTNVTSIITTNDTKKVSDGLPAGDYSVYIVAIDVAGNRSAPSPAISATVTSQSDKKMYTGFNTDGWGTDNTFCLLTNKATSMWSDTAATCQDNSGTYYDSCRAAPNDWQKVGYSCTADSLNPTVIKVHCTTSYVGFTGGSCSGGVVSSAPPASSPSTGTTSRPTLTAAVLNSISLILQQLSELITH